MKKKHVLALAVVVTAAGSIGLPLLMADRGGASGAGPGGPGGPGNAAAAQTAFAVRTANAERRTLQAYLDVNGNVVAEEQIAVLPDMEGRLISMKVSLGSAARKGDLLAEVDPSLPGKSYSLSPVYAPVSGVVVSSPVSAGSTVTKATTLLTIAVSSSIRIEANIPEREVGQLKNGLKAAVSLEAFPGETFSATVTQVSPVVDPSARTKKIILTLDKADGRVNPGMFARVRLNTRTYTDVVSVPQDALTAIRGRQGVYVREGDAARFAEVETGVTVDGETEIKSGVDAGASVVIQGQHFLSDGAKIKVLGEKI